MDIYWALIHCSLLELGKEPFVASLNYIIYLLPLSASCTSASGLFAPVAGRKNATSAKCRRSGPASVQIRVGCISHWVPNVGMSLYNTTFVHFNIHCAAHWGMCMSNLRSALCMCYLSTCFGQLCRHAGKSLQGGVYILLVGRALPPSCCLIIASRMPAV